MMVSFICDECQSTLKKAKVAVHSWQSRCPSRSFSCIDCGRSFSQHSFNTHSSCISEAEKYEGKLYRGVKRKQGEQSGDGSGGAETAESHLSIAESDNKRTRHAESAEETKAEGEAATVPELVRDVLQSSVRPSQHKTT
jgi:cell growth-regulating nucleolar protein